MLSSQITRIDFEPQLHQWHALQATQRYPVVWLCGGLGSGKSWLLVVWCFMMMAQHAPGKDGLLFQPDFATFADTFMALWRAIIPGEGTLWELRHTREGGRHLVVHVSKGTDSTLFVRSAMNAQNVMRSEGLTTIAWGAIDEPARMLCGEKAYTNTMGRLRNPIAGWEHNPLLVVGSPRGLQHWTARVFGCTEDHPAHGYTHGYETNPRPEDPTSAQRYYIRACRTADNAGHLSPNYERNYRLAVSDALAEQEMAASLLSTQGMIFPEWSKPLHVIPNELADDLWKRWVQRPIGGMDWGFTAPACVEIMGWTGDHMLLGIDEWYQRGRRYQEQGYWAWSATQRWAKRKSQAGSLTMPFYGDPADPGKIDALRKGEDFHGKRFSLDIKAAKYHGGSNVHTTAPTGWGARVEHLRNLLSLGGRRELQHPNFSADKNPGMPRYLIAARCFNMIREVPAYRQKEQQDGRPEREGATGDDHAIDATCGAAYTTDTQLQPRGQPSPRGRTRTW